MRSAQNSLCFMYGILVCQTNCLVGSILIFFRLKAFWLLVLLVAFFICLVGSTLVACLVGSILVVWLVA